MIGLADRNQVFELFENLAVGKVDKVISNLQEQYKTVPIRRPCCRI